MSNIAQDRFNGFTVNLYLDEDGDWLAHLVELPQVSAFGDSPEEALCDLDIAWRLVKESYAEDGLPIPVGPSRQDSGQFRVHIAD